MARENGTQCSLNDKIVRSFGTIACNIKPATRDKCTTYSFIPARKNVSQQTIRGFSHHTVASQTTFGGLSGTKCALTQTGFDNNLGCIEKILFLLNNDSALEHLQHQVSNKTEVICII